MKLRHALVLTAAFGFAIASLAAVARAEDRSGEAAMAGSEDPDADVVGAENPCDDLGHADGADADVVGSEDPDASVVGAGSPDASLDGDDDPDADTAESSDLDELRGDAERPTAEPAIAPMPSPPGPNADARVRAAWREVESSGRQLDAMNDAYQEMMDTNYPRGDRRGQLIAQRNEAIRDANRARARYLELAGP